MRFFSDNAAAAHPKVIEAIAASNRLDTAYDGDAWSARLDGAFSELFETEVRAFWVTTGTAANGTDYSSIAGSVTILSGQSSALVTVIPIDDSSGEGSETVIFTLSTSANYKIGTPAGEYLTR